MIDDVLSAAALSTLGGTLALALGVCRLWAVVRYLVGDDYMPIIVSCFGVGLLLGLADALTNFGRG